jgi:major vault protein
MLDSNHDTACVLMYLQVVFGPEKMVTVPSRHYCIIENPVLRDKDGSIVYEELKTSKEQSLRQVKLRHADQEIRLARDPFPLFPGEVLKKDVTPLTVVPADSALRLRATLDFEDGDANRTAGSEWLFEGPGTYIPKVEVTVEETIRASIIKPNQVCYVTHLCGSYVL